MKRWQTIGALVLLSLTIIFVVSYVAAPFLSWSSPLVDSRENDQVTIEETENSAAELSEKIIQVANSGEEVSDKMTLQTGRKGSIIVNSDEDLIDVRIHSDLNRYPNKWSLIKGESRQGLSFGSGGFVLQGDGTLGVVAVKQNQDSDTITYRVEFRSMKVNTPTGTRLEKINLVSEDTINQTGNVSITLTNRGTRRENKTISNGENADLISSLVDVSLQ